MSEEITVTKEIDLSGLNCPLPILRTKAAFANMGKGEVLKITVTNPEFLREIHNFSKQLGYPIVEENSGDSPMTFLLQKK